MKYSVSEDEKYIKEIGEFYKSLEILGADYEYDAFNNIFEEFNSSISKNKEKNRKQYFKFIWKDLFEN